MFARITSTKEHEGSCNFCRVEMVDGEPRTEPAVYTVTTGTGGGGVQVRYCQAHFEAYVGAFYLELQRLHR